MDAKLLTDDDKKLCADFIMHHFRGLVPQRKRPPLYHYTTGQSLILIIQGGKLWHTQIACMNDAKEMVHAVDLLRGAIAGRLAQEPAPRPEFRALLDRMDARLQEPHPETVGVFVSCFSEQPDDLSQWRAYGGPSGGYCVEFDPEKLLEAGLETDSYLVPVEYRAGPKQVLMEDIVKWSEQFLIRRLKGLMAPRLEEWLDEFVPYWLDELAALAPLLKHPTFEAEREWRIVHLLRSPDIRSMTFLQRNSMMTRHVPLPFAKEDAHKYTPLPIKSVMVGPTINPQLSRLAVGDLLVSRGYESVDVKLTEIPYRSAP